MNGTQSNAKKFIKKLLGFSVATWIGALLSLIVMPIVTRVFDPEEFGKVNMFQTYYTLLMYISILGLNQGYIRYYNEPPGKMDKDSLFKFCVVLSSVFTLFLCMVILISGDFFSNQIAGTNGLFIPICLSITLLANTFLLMTNTAHRMKKNTLLFSVQAIAITVAGKVTYLGVSLWNPTYQNAILIMTISFGSLAIFFLLLNKNLLIGSIYGLGRKEIIPIMGFSLPLVPVLFMSYLNTSVPKVMLTKYLDFNEVGVFSAAVSIVLIVTILQSGFNIFWTPFVYENYKLNSDKIRKVHNIITYAIVCFGLFILLFQDVLYLLLGSSYRDSKSFFALLLMSPIAYTIGETTGLGINISKKSYLNIITSSITLLINIVLCIMLIPKIGIVGSGIAVAGSSICMLIIRTILGEKYFKSITSYKKTFSSPTIFLVAAIGNYYFVDSSHIKYLLFILLILILSIIYLKELKYLYGFAIEGFKSFIKR